jgi:hypothetical protein
LFEGKKELFEGLYIYDRWEWAKTFTVIHLDFSKITYKTASLLESSLLDFVNATAEKHGVKLSSSTLPPRFAQLIEQLHKKTGSPVAILVDEYDKPLIENLSKKEIYPEVKKTLHDFYQVIKASDEHLKFVLLTGVSRFSGLSIFSGLNNLNDITIDSEHATICGYTQEELESNFKGYIEEVGKSLNMSYKETLDTIKRWYNGYSWDGKSFVYNPFLTLLLFKKKEFGNYWFETGTPTFLIEEIKKKNDLYSFVANQEVESDTLKGNGNETQETTTLLFQTGYLTVKNKKLKKDAPPQYTLDFPNMEVRKAFLSSLLVAYANKETKEIKSIGERVREAIEQKDGQWLRELLIELYANIPYNLTKKEESHYHALFIMAAIMSGFERQGEACTNKGRPDAVLKKEGKTTIVEIKYGEEVATKKLVKEAIEQIREKRYYEKYGKKDVSLLGIGFGKAKEIECEFEDA